MPLPRCKVPDLRTARHHQIYDWRAIVKVKPKYMTGAPLPIYYPHYDLHAIAMMLHALYRYTVVVFDRHAITKVLGEEHVIV